MTGASTSRRPGLSVRVKLTLSYAAFLIIAGATLFTVGLLLLRFVPEGALYAATGRWAPNRGDLLDVFVRYTWWAIALLVAIGLGGGWLLAGLMLRPLDRIADTARRVRDGRLSHRVALPGRRDELTELADTLDTMLDGLQATIEEERRFAANASHELRTPHAIIRTMVEVAQADPGTRDVDEVLRRIAATNDRAIATTEALLVLARVGSGAALDRAAVDVTSLVAECVAVEREQAAGRGIRLETSLGPAGTSGSRPLLERMVGNLIRNAVVHNVDDGWMEVALTEGENVELRVTNSGPRLDPATIATLSEPFVRGAGRTRRSGEDGSGLGLAIAASVARAHGGTLSVAGVADGGIDVRVVLPTRPSAAGQAPPAP